MRPPNRYSRMMRRRAQIVEQIFTSVRSALTRKLLEWGLESPSLASDVMGPTIGTSLIAQQWRVISSVIRLMRVTAIAGLGTRIGAQRNELCDGKASRRRKLARSAELYRNEPDRMGEKTFVSTASILELVYALAKNPRHHLRDFY